MCHNKTAGVESASVSYPAWKEIEQRAAVPVWESPFCSIEDRVGALQRRRWVLRQSTLAEVHVKHDAQASAWHPFRSSVRRVEYHLDRLPCASVSPSEQNNWGDSSWAPAAGGGGPPCPATALRRGASVLVPTSASEDRSRRRLGDVAEGPHEPSEWCVGYGVGC